MNSLIRWTIIDALTRLLRFSIKTTIPVKQTGHSRYHKATLKTNLVTHRVTSSNLLILISLPLLPQNETQGLHNSTTSSNNEHIFGWENFLPKHFFSFLCKPSNKISLQHLKTSQLLLMSYFYLSLPNSLPSKPETFTGTNCQHRFPFKTVSYSFLSHIKVKICLKYYKATFPSYKKVVYLNQWCYVYPGAVLLLCNAAADRTAEKVLAPHPPAWSLRFYQRKDIVCTVCKIRSLLVWWLTSMFVKHKFLLV